MTIPKKPVSKSKVPAKKPVPAKATAPAVAGKVSGKPESKLTPVVAAGEETFTREYWTGDSRDGILVNGDGYHFYRMTKAGQILEAYEYYETEDGREFVSPLPEMLHVHWIDDLGFEDFEALDMIKEYDFQRIKEISAAGSAG